MRSTGVPSRTSSTSPDNSCATTSRRSSWGRSRRTFMACTECRRRQVKCTPSDSAGQACERCAKRKIKCEFMSIQEQKLLSTPDNDQSSTAITLHLPQYGGAVGGLSCQMPAGPILGDPADVRQGILTAPTDHPLVRPTGTPISATSLPLHHQPRQQVVNPSVQSHHRPETPSWNPHQYPQPTSTPRHATPTGMTPIPQNTTSTPWYLVNNSQSQPQSNGYYPPGHSHAQVRASPDVQWKDSRRNTQA